MRLSLSGNVIEMAAGVSRLCCLSINRDLLPASPPLTMKSSSRDRRFEQAIELDGTIDSTRLLRDYASSRHGFSGVENSR
jgi:hypothetical protein